MDFSKTDKRLLRSTLRTYERTGKYVFLKLFKKTADEKKFEQRISLNLQEFRSLVKTAQNILESVVQDKSAKDCSTKPPPNKKPKLQHESKDDGSSV